MNEYPKRRSIVLIWTMFAISTIFILIWLNSQEPSVLLDAIMSGISEGLPLGIVLAWFLLLLGEVIAGPKYGPVGAGFKGTVIAIALLGVNMFMLGPLQGVVIAVFYLLGFTLVFYTMTRWSEPAQAAA